MAPVSGFLLVSTPESVGLLPDGRPIHETGCSEHKKGAHTRTGGRWGAMLRRLPRALRPPAAANCRPSAAGYEMCCESDEEAGKGSGAHRRSGDGGAGADSDDGSEEATDEQEEDEGLHHTKSSSSEGELRISADGSAAFPETEDWTVRRARCTLVPFAFPNAMIRPAAYRPLRRSSTDGKYNLVLPFGGRPAQAIRTRSFWTMTLVGLVICCSTGAVTTHMAMIAADFGLSVAQMSKRIVMPCALSALCADFVIGRELDRGRVGPHTLFALTELSLVGAPATGASVVSPSSAFPPRSSRQALVYHRRVHLSQIIAAFWV